MEPNYRLNCGQYVFHDGDTPLYAPHDEIALAFDRESGTLHKHGPVEKVAAWHSEAVRKFRAAGFDDMADELVMISGRFPVEEINKCINNSTYPQRFYQKLMAGEIRQEPWPGMEDA